jgi:hypothetical protein
MYDPNMLGSTAWMDERFYALGRMIKSAFGMAAGDVGFSPLQFREAYAAFTAPFVPSPER